LAKSTTRVHLLAKELGVKSKAIVEKCQAEGLDIRNHMSTISVGLAATIHEWFSEGQHTNTIETTKRVDLKKVRVARKRPKKSDAEIEPVKEIASVQEVVQDHPVEVVKSPAAEKKKPLKPRPSTRPVVRKPPKLKPVVPAGPMLEKPKPAELSGPNVIRVEKDRLTR